MYCVSSPGWTRQCGIKYIGISLQTLQDEEIFLFLENIIRGGTSSVIEDRNVKSDETIKILYIDAKNLYGNGMSQPLPYVDSERKKDVKLEDTLNTPDDSDTAFFVEFS